ncbi:hypothetical protein HGRIS_001887 [Hohenbuehelia grisea]|uniref:Uncharacterized protein n=1 Tax=Hohenbuehelia grisea TaxID=104357 RepID=A0ABR3JKI8_9AGAR
MLLNDCRLITTQKARAKILLSEMLNEVGERHRMLDGKEQEGTLAEALPYTTTRTDVMSGLQALAEANTGVIGEFSTMLIVGFTVEMMQPS